MLTHNPHNSSKKIPLWQRALSKHGLDLHVPAKNLVRTWIQLASAQPAILSVRTPTSVTKMTQICPILPQTFMGIIRGPERSRRGVTEELDEITAVI